MLAVAQGCQIFVGGLALRCEEDALLAYFSRFGSVSDYTIVRDPETKLSRGFGFVTFPDALDAAAAVGASHGVEIRDLSAPHGRLSVRLAEKSKAQLEFEARRPAARAETGPADGGKGEKAQPADGGGRTKAKMEGKLEQETRRDEVSEAAAVEVAGVADDSVVAQPLIRAMVEARGRGDNLRAGDSRPPPPPPPPALPANAGVRQWPAPSPAVPPPPASAGPSTAPSERRAAVAAGAKLGRSDVTGGACGRRSGDKPPRPAREVLPAGAEAA
jgi:hypothetical protein